MPKQFLTYLFVFLFGSSAFSQLTTNKTLTPEQLVQNILVGQGIDVFNVTFTGAGDAIGGFDASASNVGIDNGVILSTGSVLDHQAGGRQNGPVGPNNTGSATTAWNTAGDADLTAIIGSQTHDAVILEFDFIPQGDTLRFNYVFASEEYIEFSGANSTINDAFAFYISGPGFGSPTNIAVLPGTNTPVSIKNVNDWNNSSYFIDNGDGFSGPQVTDPSVVNFDGLTVKLSAVTKVTPCQTYHLRLVLADGGDASLDSGVFLQAGSLNSNPAFSYVINKLFNPLNEDTLLSEGCSNGRVTFNRYDEIWNPYTLDFRVLGTATNGVDYTLSDNKIDFAANVDEAILDITSITDVLAEGTESIILRFPSPFVCIPDSVDIIYNIMDKEVVSSTTFNGQVNCKGDEIELEASGSGGVPDYQYSWSNGITTKKNKVSPTTTTTYYYTITDACGQTKDDSAIVTVPVFQTLVANTSNDTVLYCPGVTVDLKVIGSGGGGTYVYDWDSGETVDEITKTVTADATYSVTIFDNCGDSAKGSVFVDLQYVPFSVEAFKDSTICYGDSASLFAIASGGVQPYKYVWETGDLTPSSIYDGLTSQFVTVSATDSCGIVPALDSVFVTVQKPTANFEIVAPLAEVLENIYYENTSIGNSLSYSWDLGNNETSILEDPETVYTADSTYIVSLIVEDDLGCRDTVEKPIKISPPLYFYMPNSFTPNGDGLNDEFLGYGIGVKDFELSIYDRWGIELFVTENYREGWDGRYKSGKYVPLGVYVYRMIVIGESGEEVEKIGKVTLIR